MTTEIISKVMAGRMDGNQSNYRKFLIVTDRIDAKIRNGLIPSGKPFMDRAALCDEYGVSPVTAHKIQRELVRRGLLLPRSGRSFAVCDPKNLGTVPLREIRLLRQVPAESDPLMDSIARGAKESAAKHHLEFSETYLELLDEKARKISLSGECEEGQGMILLPYRSIMVRGASFFLKWWNRRVTIDFPLPGTPGVCLDFYDGVERLLDSAKQRGAASIMVIPNRPNAWDPMCDTGILRYSEIYAARLGLKYFSSTSGNVETMIRDIRKHRPDAILFHATHHRGPFLRQFLEKCPYSPMLFGFAQNDTPELPGFTLYRVDYADLGFAAAELLRSLPGIQDGRGLLRFIKGALTE